METNSHHRLRLLIDCRKAWDAGIGTYIRNVVPRVLRRLPGASVRVLIAPGTAARHDYLRALTVEFVEDAGRPLGLGEQWRLRRILRPDEIFWATSLAHPLFWRGPLMATVHDVAQLALETRAAGGRLVRGAARLYLQSLRRRAGLLLFISDFTSGEFDRYVGASRGAVCVTPLGVDAGWFEAQPPALPGARPYFISVGSIRPHKNLHTLLAAFAQVRDHLPHELVIVGRHEGFRTRDSDFEELLAPLGERVRFLGAVDDAVLRQQVAGACALVFPSLYEGFGLPPLEAMAAGCPVIVSRAGALAEVCAGAARYFETRSVESLAAALLDQARQSPADRQAQVAQGRERARRYSWEHTADLTAQALGAHFGPGGAKVARPGMASAVPDMRGDIRPLHIGKFVPPPYAGVEAHVDTLLRVLQPEARGALLAGSSPTEGDRALAGLPYRVLVARSYGKLASATLSPAVPWLARREIVSGRCNLLHIHAPNPWGDLAALACPREVPVVMSWHSDIVRQRRLMLAYQYIQRGVLARADRIIVFTPKHYESSAQLHQRDVSAKIAYVPMGIDFAGLAPELADPAVVARLQAWAAGRPLLLTVGRHVYYKGYAYLLAAMARLRSEAVLVMVGAGVLTPALQQQARELGLGQRVLFLGEVERAALVAALHACDAFALPSIAPSEAFGIASAEAMACGKPTVVCELGNGVNYLNREGQTSLVVPPRQVDALADALDTLALDAGLRQRMGQTARAWVRGEFSLEAMKQGTLAVYRSLL